MINPGLAAAVHGAGAEVGHVEQTEIVADLFNGAYDAATTVGAAFTGCILGHGVAEHLDGEIVAFDGEVWRVPADGVPVRAPDSLGLPFAIAAFGGSPVELMVPPGSDLAAITALIDDELEALSRHHDEVVVAVRIDGAFSDVVMRSEHRQEPPYRALADVLAAEVRFEFATWQGTLVGFRCPDVADGVVIPGLHMHGLSDDRASGGHCRSAITGEVRLRLWIDDLTVEVPHSSVSAALSRGDAPDLEVLHAAESDPSPS